MENSFCRRAIAIFSLACAFLAIDTTASGAQLLANGQFDNVHVGWAVPSELGTWIPYTHPDRTVSLHPDSGMYYGVILAQPLNISGIANQSVSGSIDLGASWAPPSGKTVAVYLEFLDNTGGLHRQKLINPDNAGVPLVPPNSLVAFTGNFTFPANASKLVGLTIEKEGDGPFFADNVSLTSATLTPGTLPHLTNLSAKRVAYGQSFTITGSGLSGSVAPVVLLNGSSAGLAVTAWSANSITVTASAPAATGALTVRVDGVPACEFRKLEITSPHYWASLKDNTFHVAPGQPVSLPVRVEFRNGFASDVSIQVLKNGVSFPGATAAPNPVVRDGGTLVTVDTSALPAGTNRLSVRPVANSVNGSDSFFDIFVEPPASLQLSVNGSPVVGTISLTDQTTASTSYQLMDATGTALAAAPDLVWWSSNESVFEVFQDTGPWYTGPQLLVHGNGDAILYAAGPGGLSFQFPVHVAALASPHIISCVLGNSVMDNLGASNSQYFQTDVVIPKFQRGASGDINITWGDATWSSDLKAVSANFSVGQGQAPGKFLFNASGGGPTGYNVLTIVNASNKGAITGRVVSYLSSSGQMSEISGTLEFYNASTGDKVFPGAAASDMAIWTWGPEYNASYLTPGSYKVRWVPETWTNGIPQWWPNATTFAEASPVAVTAGSVTSGIHFFVTEPATPASPPQTAGPAVFNPATSILGIPIQTENGVTYQLQRSNSLLDGSWYNVGSLAYGDGTVQTLQDTEAAGTKSFFRVLRK